MIPQSSGYEVVPHSHKGQALVICSAGVVFFFRSVGTALILSVRVVSGSSLRGNARREEGPQNLLLGPVTWFLSGRRLLS